MSVIVLKRDTEIEQDVSNCAEWEKLTAICFRETGIFKHQTKEICLSFCDEKEIRELNKNFRAKDKVTDVLSFNSVEPLVDLAGDETQSLGDIIICTKRAAEQAKEYGYSLKREIIFLFIHGLLHLLGFDHETDKEAEEMFRIQRQVLLTYGILD